VYIKPTQKTTKLGTSLTFDVLDLRGRQGFPESQRGLVFVHKNTPRVGLTFVVRTGSLGRGQWRVDMVGLIPEAIYGPSQEVIREDYFPTNEAAARALAKYLEG
jgi:hypothetical protein